MTNNNDNILENDRFALEDKAGRAEIEDAIKEIQRLKAGGSPKIPEEKEETIPGNESEEQETVVEDPEEEQELEELDGEEEEEQEELAVKKSPKKLDKIWKIKKGYYKEKAEKRAALDEVARLREMVSQLETAGTYQYGRNVYTELDRAKELMKKAVAEGNAETFAEATSNLTNAQYKVNELERLAAQSPAPPPQQQYYPSNEGFDNEIFNEAVQDFLSSHKELQQDSKFYNKALAESVVKYANKLDRQIKEAGREDIYYTEAIEDYFDAIEDHMADYHAKSAKQQKNLEAANHVGGVRNSYSSSAPGKSPPPIKVTLTPDEKKMCANSFGKITEEDWLKFKYAEQLKEGKSL